MNHLEQCPKCGEWALEELDVYMYPETRLLDHELRVVLKCKCYHKLIGPLRKRDKAAPRPKCP